MVTSHLQGMLSVYIHNVSLSCHTICNLALSYCHCTLVTYLWHDHTFTCYCHTVSKHSISHFVTFATCYYISVILNYTFTAFHCHVVLYNISLSYWTIHFQYFTVILYYTTFHYHCTIHFQYFRISLLMSLHIYYISLSYCHWTFQFIFHQSHH